MSRRLPSLPLCALLALAALACDKPPTPPAAPGSGASAAPAGGAPSAKAQPPAQALPVIAMLRAAQAKDAAAFRATYAKRIRDGKEQSDWEKNVAEANASVGRLFGGASVDELTFTFTGDADAGKVTIARPSQPPVTLAVVREGTEWKLDER